MQNMKRGKKKNPQPTLEDYISQSQNRKWRIQSEGLIKKHVRDHLLNVNFVCGLENDNLEVAVMLPVRVRSPLVLFLYHKAGHHIG